MMRIHRIRRRLAFALVLVPVTMISIGFGQASPAASEDTATKATVKAEGTVRFGDRVRLRGEFPDSARAEVAILHRSAGEGSFSRVASTRTGAGGRWTTRVKPRRTGDWRAQLASSEPADPLTAESERDSVSDSERIRVRSVTKVVPTKRDVIAGSEVEIRGQVLPAGQRDVLVDLGGQIERAHANKNGRFALDLRVPDTGTHRVSAEAKGNRDASGSKDAGGTVTAYRYAQASWYGPGLYGNRTACGQTLTPSTRGVAHKALPCGTKLSIRHGSREVHVRVIDRGPYVGNREFDLTSATKEDLGFSGTGRILVDR
ncbi:MAG: septal ring lytic transglycosylase RlpA family protein [Actinomycetota bacterium]|nr:septal ring lytic transglycosylase RlpA family protein [Actinomycetota bacterium]